MVGPKGDGFLLQMDKSKHRSAEKVDKNIFKLVQEHEETSTIANKVLNNMHEGIDVFGGQKLENVSLVEKDIAKRMKARKVRLKKVCKERNLSQTR